MIIFGGYTFWYIQPLNKTTTNTTTPTTPPTTTTPTTANNAATTTGGPNGRDINNNAFEVDDDGKRYNLTRELIRFNDVWR